MGGWRSVTAAAALSFVAVSCRHDPDGEDAAAGGDGDAGLAPGDAPRCEATAPGGLSVGGFDDDEWGDSRTMYVASLGREGLSAEDDYVCDPPGEVVVRFQLYDFANPGWLPSRGRQVVATLWESYDSGYGELRSPEGVLIVEGGYFSGASTPPGHVRLVDDPEAVTCTPDDLPADDECCCTLLRPMHVVVSTDDGDVELAEDESRHVSIEGDDFVATAFGAHDIVAVTPCQTDGGAGPWADVMLVRSEPLELPVADPGPALADDCPADMPAEGSACTTRPGLQCPYERAPGCSDTYECRGCYWFVPLRSGGIECGLDPDDCMTNGNDGACSEEAVCTHCPCNDPLANRFRCVWPGDDCPPCE